MAKRVQTGVPTQQLVAQFGLRGSVDLGLDEIIVPVCILSDLTGQIEKRPAHVSVDLAAPAAGRQNICSLNNPAGSGVVCRVVQMIFRNTANPDMFELTYGGASPGVNGEWRDNGLTGDPAIQLVTANVPTAAMGQVLYPVETTYTYYSGEWVLQEGAGLVIRQENAVEPMQVTFLWTEENLE